MPSSGILQVYIVFVDFEDAPASENVANLFDLFIAAASEWYETTSFGRLNLRVAADLSRFYRMPRDASAYNYRRGKGREYHRNYVQDALDAVGQSVDFSGTDLMYMSPPRKLLRSHIH